MGLWKLAQVCVAVCCSVLQCDAMCCSELYLVAMCCNILQFMCRIVLQCTVLQCNALRDRVDVAVQDLFGV